MNIYQANQIQSPKNSRHLMLLHGLNLIFILLNFSLNFLGSPLLKYVYILHVMLILFAISLYDFDEIFMEIITLLFLEGQGRILWEYQVWARVIFDISVLLSIIKVFIKNKKIFDKKLIPSPLYILIILHFIWYFIELFNIYTASMFGVLGASKIYIYPFLFFLGLLQTNLKFEKSIFPMWLKLLVLFIVLENCLSIYQVTMKQQLLLEIHPYYIVAMKNGVFTGHKFRPFGTTFIPGAYSTFLYLTVGILFFKKFNHKYSLLRVVLLVLSVYVLILCQVRSAIVKYALIVGLIQLGLMLFERFHPKRVIPVVLVFVILTLGTNSFLQDTEKGEDENVDYARKRISTLTEVDKIKSERISIETFVQIVSSKIKEYPLGMGPGMTGAASSLNAESLKDNPIIRGDMLWASDNLFVSLFMDLGIGALFYIFLILFIPIYFIRFLLIAYYEKQSDEYQILLACFASIVVIILGNWGALALPYNPESFFYWFFSAIGFKIIFNIKENSKMEKVNVT